MTTIILDRKILPSAIDNSEGWGPEDEFEPTFRTREEEKKYFSSRFSREEINAVFPAR